MFPRRLPPAPQRLAEVLSCGAVVVFSFVGCLSWEEYSMPVVRSLLHGRELGVHIIYSNSYQGGFR